MPETFKREYKMYLNLTEEEFLALARMSHKEMRSPRWQAIILIKKGLRESGYLANEDAAQQLRAVDGGDAGDSKSDGE